MRSDVDRLPAVIWQWAAEAPERTAVTCASRSLTYAQLKIAIVRTADVLRLRGIRPGDRVLIVAENNAACMVLLFAAQLLKAWPAVVNARVAPAEFIAMQAWTTPRLAIFAIEGAPAALTLATSLGHWQRDHIPAGEVIFGRADAKTEREPVKSLAAEQVGLLIFTSGTLGTPKAVMLSHAALLYLGRVLASSRETSAGDIIHGIAPLGDDSQCTRGKAVQLHIKYLGM